MKTQALASSLRNIVSGLTRRLKKTVKSNESFSLSEYATLSYLYTDEMLSISDLAALVSVRAQSMSESLIRLEDMGIVERRPSEADKRKSLISLTQKGKQYVEQTRYERDAWLAEAIDNTLTGKEKVLLQQAVALMVKVMEYK